MRVETRPGANKIPGMRFYFFFSLATRSHRTHSRTHSARTCILTNKRLANLTAAPVYQTTTDPRYVAFYLFFVFPFFFIRHTVVSPERPLKASDAYKTDGY